MRKNYGCAWTCCAKGARRSVEADAICTFLWAELAGGVALTVCRAQSAEVRDGLHQYHAPWHWRTRPPNILRYFGRIVHGSIKADVWSKNSKFSFCSNFRNLPVCHTSAPLWRQECSRSSQIRLVCCACRRDQTRYDSLKHVAMFFKLWLINCHLNY